MIRELQQNIEEKQATGQLYTLPEIPTPNEVEKNKTGECHM